MEKRMTNPKSEGYISAKDMAGRAAYYKVLQAAKNGELTRIKRGVYATDDHLSSQMLDVEKVFPGGVLCLYSAWSHYQLTTQVPQEYCLAIKRGRKITLPDYPPITLLVIAISIYLVNTLVKMDSRAAAHARLQWLHAPKCKPIHCEGHNIPSDSL